MVEQVLPESTSLSVSISEQLKPPSINESPTLTARELAEGRISFFWTKFFETPPTRRLSVTSQISAYLDHLEETDEMTLRYIMEPHEIVDGKQLNVLELLKLEIEKFNRKRITKR